MIDTPKSTLIEKTAIELAAAFYDEARRQGIPTAPYRNERQYVKKNFEKFIPKAVELLTHILSTSNSDAIKQEIYEALIERANWTPTLNGQKIDSKFLN